LVDKDRRGGGVGIGNPTFEEDESRVLKEQAQYAFALFVEIFGDSFPPSAFAQVQSIVKISSKRCLLDGRSWSAFTMGNAVYIKASPESFNCEDSENFKRLIVALFELTEEILRCDRLVFCLDRHNEGGRLQTLIKALLYVGFELTPSAHRTTSPAPSSSLIFLGYNI
jgi:hypothetical protein